MTFGLALLSVLISMILEAVVLYHISKSRRLKYEKFINRELHKIKSNSYVRLMG